MNRAAGDSTREKVGPAVPKIDKRVFVSLDGRVSLERRAKILIRTLKGGRRQTAVHGSAP